MWMWMHMRCLPGPLSSVRPYRKVGGDGAVSGSLSLYGATESLQAADKLRKAKPCPGAPTSSVEVNALLLGGTAMGAAQGGGAKAGR